MRNTLSIPLFWGGGTPLKPDRQSLLRLIPPVLFLLMLMTGNFALATGLYIQVTGTATAIPATAIAPATAPPAIVITPGTLTAGTNATNTCNPTTTPPPAPPPAVVSVVII